MLSRKQVQDDPRGFHQDLDQIKGVYTQGLFPGDQYALHNIIVYPEWLYRRRCHGQCPEDMPRPQPIAR